MSRLKLNEVYFLTNYIFTGFCLGIRSLLGSFSAAAARALWIYMSLFQNNDYLAAIGLMSLPVRDKLVTLQYDSTYSIFALGFTSIILAIKYYA